jgi:glycosyltransferase involved in cell wall biosynthesis
MKKILIVAMADSVHTARWIRQFDSDEIEFVLFPSTPHRRIHGLIVEHKQVKPISSLRISRFMTIGALPLGLLDLLFKNFFRSKILAREIKTFQPDTIHIMETQHSGYLAYKAFKKTQTDSRIILSIWGSDLFWFQKFKGHKRKITRLLSLVHLLVTECHRDEELARKFGFIGECLHGVPASGGFDHQDFSEFLPDNPPSKRRTISIKGYSGFVGLGPTAIRGLKSISSYVKNYEIVIYSASPYSKLVARRVKLATGLEIKIYLKHSLTPIQMQDLFLRSRVVLGMSKSDGLPATIKEAMFTGAFPVQTGTSCTSEWLKDGISTLLISPTSTLDFEEAMQRAIEDNELVDTAAQINFEIAKTRMDRVVVRRKALSAYGIIS